jgi:hypothetical protein
LEGLLKEDPQLFGLILPQDPNVVERLRNELASRRLTVYERKKSTLPLSESAKAVVAAAGTEQRRLGHSAIATQHLLFALLSARDRRSTWFRKASELPVQQFLSKYGITAQLTEERTKAGIVTPLTWILDDEVVALNAQVAALAELLMQKGIFTRPEFVFQLDHNDGPLVPEFFISPLIRALEKKGILTADERREMEAPAAQTQVRRETGPTHDDEKLPS